MINYSKMTANETQDIASAVPQSLHLIKIQKTLVQANVKP